MEGEVPLLGIAPVSSAELELSVTHVGHPVTVDLHFVGHVAHPWRLDVQLEAVGVELLQLEPSRSQWLGPCPQLDHPLQHAQRIGHLALVVAELRGVLHLQLQRGTVVRHEDAVIEAHDALVVVQPGERWWRLAHRVAAQVHRPAHIGVLHGQGLVEEPVGFI